MTRTKTALAVTIGAAALISIGAAAADARQPVPDPAVEVDRAHSSAPAIGPRTSEMRTVNISPCRIVDTRAGGGGRLAADTVRSYDARGTLSGQGGAGGCNVPASAEAIEANITAVDPSGSGWVRAKAYDGSPALHANTVLNYWLVGVTNGTQIPLCTGTCASDLTIGAFGAATDIVIDVTAYSVPPMYIVLDGEPSTPVVRSAKRMEFTTSTLTGEYLVSTTDGTQISGCGMNATAGSSDTTQAAFPEVNATVRAEDADTVRIRLVDETGASVDDDVVLTVDC